MSNSVSLQENHSKTIASLIEIMENNFANKREYVSCKALNLSQKEIEIINTNPRIFFKCSSKRVVLTKWIIDETEKLFINNNYNVIPVNTIYNHLRDSFRTMFFNKYNLQQLFYEDNTLEYNVFIQVRNNVLSKFNRYYAYKASQLHREVEIKNNLQLAREDLGDELFEHFLRNKNEVICLFKLLSDLIKEEEHVNKLRIAIEAIHETLLPTRIKPLLSAFRIEKELRDALLKLFLDNDIFLVKELSNLLTVSVENTFKLPLLNFVEWLSDDKIAFIRNRFQKIFKTGRDISILKIRATGATLESTGKEFGITRERVRQIEQKLLLKFNRYLTIIKPYHILQAYTKNNVVLTVSSIRSQIGELSDVFIYFLKKCQSKEAIWNDKLKGFILNNSKSKWYEQVLKSIDRLPEMFEASNLEGYIYDINNMLNTKIDHSIVGKLIVGNYHLYGNIYSKRKINKADIYLATLERYYPYGIKLFDDFEMMRFRNYAKRLFGDIDLPENDRAIYTRIADLTVLCDRGKYILPNRIKCVDEILNKICRFVEESSRNVFMFRELFERFKIELLAKTNINNRFFLHGVLKYKYADKYFFAKDTLIKDVNNEQDIKLSIEEFIKKQAQIVTKDEVRKEFLGISDAVLQAAIANSSNILLWGFGSYLHAEQLKIDKETKDRFKKLLYDYTAKGTVSAHKIYSDIYLLENDFMLFNNINGYTALYSVFNYLFPNDFEYSRPYIASKGSTVLTFDTVVREYLSGYNEIYISKLKNYIESIRRSSISISLLLDDISDEFIRIDHDLLIRKNRLDLSEEIIESIEAVTLALIGDIGYHPVTKMGDYTLYPNVGVKWTPFLLVSIVNYYCKKLKIINTTADYRYLNEIIVSCSINIDDYDELLRYALKKEDRYISFKNIHEIKEFLLKQGLIAQNIPQSLFEKGYLSKDEYDRVTIV